MVTKRVFVSGSFDSLHACHVNFLRRAAEFGELHVSLADDETIPQRHGKLPLQGVGERQYLLESLECVHQVVVGSGSGVLGFLNELNEIRPDMFVVDADGDRRETRELCRQRGIEYKVLDEVSTPGRPADRATETAKTNVPYRIDLAGGWLDQPWVSKLAPGPVVTLSLEPTHAFSLRGGMATSTRARAMRLWGNTIPLGDPEEMAKILFCFENPPGTPEISGSQDSLGMVMPGVNRFHYEGEYWPERIDSMLDEETLSWLERHLQLVFLYPRPDGFSVLRETNVNAAQARMLARYADHVWDSILARDLDRLGHYMTASFRMQTSMFPAMAGPEIETEIDRYLGRIQGVKISGAGGGGYLVLVTDQEIEGSVRLTARRSACLTQSPDMTTVRKAA